MCTPSQCKAEAGTFLDSLGRLSTAEEFFTILDVPFEQSVVHVSRLHILKRFHDLLDTASIRMLSDGDQKVACQAALSRAYADFAEGRGAKTFKVFQQGKMGFVPLGAIEHLR